MNTLLALLASGILASALISQAVPPQDPDWIGNIKEAPLFIIKQGNAIILKNRTDKLIESYRLACTVAQTDHATVVHRFRSEHIPISPLGDVTYAAFDGPPKEQVICQNLGAKLSILDTTFKDGSSWHLPDNPSHSSPRSVPNR